MKKLIARFSDGVTKTRRTDRPYTHAFRLVATWPLTAEYLAAFGDRFYPGKKAGDIVTRIEFGFSSSERLARVGADRYAQGYGRNLGATFAIEVVPVEVL